MDNPVERRSVRKDSLNLLDYVVMGNKEQPLVRAMGRTLNISEAGLLFETHIPLEPEQMLLITIELEEDLVEIKGRVRHVEPCAEKFHSGIEFLEIDAEGQRVLKKYLDSFAAARA
jgi:c-di-GMP-binding flagellar brake protein YcgR